MSRVGVCTCSGEEGQGRKGIIGKEERETEGIIGKEEQETSRLLLI